MTAHTLSREEIENWREYLLVDEIREEECIQIGILCDMALEALEGRLRPEGGIAMDTARLDWVLNHTQAVDQVDMRMWDTEEDFLKAAREGIDKAMGFPSLPQGER